jgi:putative flippase GtrA
MKLMRKHINSIMYNPLVTRLRHHAFLRYTIIGGSAFIFDISLLNLGLHFGLSLLVANGIAVVFAIIYSFLLHRSFTFAHRAREKGYLWRGRYQFVSFVTVSLLALLLNESLMLLFVKRYSMHASLAKTITSAILFIWNYSINAALTFRTKKVMANEK